MSETCPICERGEPLGVLVERWFSWITADEKTVTHGYLCVVAKRHVVEVFDLDDEERHGFWEDISFAAERLAAAARPQKINIELHGNTLQHLHAHIYARYRDDRFAGGPIDYRLEPVDNLPLDELRAALA